MNFYIDSTMPQAGMNLPAQNHASYEVSALPPSHHGWIESTVFTSEKFEPFRDNMSANYLKPMHSLACPSGDTPF